MDLLIESLDHRHRIHSDVSVRINICYLCMTPHYHFNDFMHWLSWACHKNKNHAISVWMNFGGESNWIKTHFQCDWKRQIILPLEDPFLLFLSLFLFVPYLRNIYSCLRNFNMIMKGFTCHISVKKKRNLYQIYFSSEREKKFEINRRQHSTHIK